MGSDYTTYLGPYLECKITKVAGKEVRRTCTNKKCKNRKFGAMNSKFCHDCGFPVGDVDFPLKINNVKIWELVEKIDSEMITPSGDYFYQFAEKQGIHVWYGSKKRPHADSRPFSFDPTEDVQLIPLEIVEVNEEIDEFLRQYATSIEIIKEAYGAINVECKWGLVSNIA